MDNATAPGPSKWFWDLIGPCWCINGDTCRYWPHVRQEDAERAIGACIVERDKQIAELREFMAGDLTECMVADEPKYCECRPCRRRALLAKHGLVLP